METQRHYFDMRKQTNEKCKTLLINHVSGIFACYMWKNKYIMLKQGLLSGFTLLSHDQHVGLVYYF